MEYNHKSLEKKWQKFWADHQTYKTSDTHQKPKYYVLDMFPYPSGAGLHVGHPLGYIASDIFSRYKRLKGFNVLHPMGYDSFGLPAEQYAIQTGQHPAVTTEVNINRYREQMDNIGFSYDWSREVRTSDPSYYKWTQWIFMRLFDSWYNKESDKAEPIETLIARFVASGSAGILAVSDEDVLEFSADEWKSFDEEKQQRELLKYRIAYLRESTVNWCAALGTVLANDEVINGVSERGGYPVEQKKMMQWSMRITAYADRLLKGLDTIDWPEPLVEMQRNWIGKSVGASVKFPVPQLNTNIEVFTTRVDTLFGVSFIVLAPEHELVAALTTPEQQAEVDAYIEKTAKKSELDRMADTKTVSGAFTGSYAKHPVSGQDVQIWIADYVLAGYGTGAVMAVPSGDQRDYVFAKHFALPIIPISDTQHIEEEADPNKDGKYINSDFINGMTYQEAVPALIAKLEELKLGKAKINFRMRDAIFGRQRYWGEPVPVYFKNGLPYLIKEEELPLLLPEVDKYLPTESGEPPLGRAKDWKYEDQYEYELSTMPGWAGSSWYWFRYMDPKNEGNFASKEAVDYWKAVDLYIGGSEHATGHLLYSRFWNKFLKDLGYQNEEEPFRKLINQGMIQGRSNFVYRVLDEEGRGTNRFVSYGLRNEYKTIPLHVDVNIVYNDQLDLEKFKAFRPDFANAEFVLENGKYICGSEVEKMSKSKFNVVNPDDIIESYGADTLRLYEMFLGPLEQAKPWNTNGIEGVYKFLRKVWRLFHDAEGSFTVSDEDPSKAEFKALHKIIKKVEDDIERFSFNTSVSAFMICVNELTELKCNKRQILEQLVIILQPYAPHITEELWALLGNEAGTLSYASYPVFKPEYLVESEFAYPVSFNGKMKFNLSLALDLDQKAVEDTIKAHADVQRHLDGKAIKKIIFVKGKIINIVI
ncbi:MULTISPECIES: leucine--tRNA ligase [Sphingobacterium]|uniref:Leucine--tRNA ligase n=1 Tax=Sphingobacterium multivorum TaxID=28454 RepID=A0A654DZE0_SPHMU|nr:MULTISPECIES: leucine--tRNA ligase [Sphingobacterium]HAE69868.1 leucine--tRNA ligase [Sphingobacterium sp.]OFV15342.1 leucine--tRNA ligase [Sphingobacterium sp. HMSC13C05]QQT46495.1 leucine--tRNA ligase [Sphingobacterium multivorum]SUJ90063.1 Leucine--tRNA ligase [Sphingobacterium multivorum]VXD07973.1 Leucine--tRNA ligase [Sphingobacterium multivorum]